MNQNNIHSSSSSSLHSQSQSQAQYHYTTRNSSSSSKNHGHVYHSPSAYIQQQQCAVYNCKRLSPLSSSHGKQQSHKLNTNQSQIAQLCFPSIAAQESIKKGDLLCDTHYSMLESYYNDVVQHAGRNLSQFSTSWHQHDDMPDSDQHLDDATNMMSSTASNQSSPSHSSYQNDTDHLIQTQSIDGSNSSTIQVEKFKYPLATSTRHHYDDDYAHDIHRALARRNLMRSKFDYTLTTTGWIYLIVFLTVIFLYSIVSFKNGNLFD